MNKDNSFTLKKLNLLEQKHNALYSHHIAPLTCLVQHYHEKGVNMPWIDPADGGVQARILILLQSPARSELVPRFVSLDNPCPSQQNLHRFLKQAGIKRKDIILWNTMPWLTISGKKISPTRNNIRRGVEVIKSLMPLLKDLTVIILAGSVALQTRPFFEREYPHVTLLTMPHPSPLSLCRAPSVSEAIKTTLHQAYLLITPHHTEIKGDHTL
ncbi:TPA: uracil-DNA glycosylase [Escherichia coli]|nr:uracil-DNA glycosylase [Escherichia coli]